MFKFSDEKEQLKCSFCGKPGTGAQAVAGPGVYICDDALSFAMKL